MYEKIDQFFGVMKVFPAFTENHPYRYIAGKEKKMAVEKSLVSGSMTMLILKLLSEKDMYGYEMIDTLRQKSQNVFELKAGTLYPLLHGLEDKGMLKVYEKEYAGKIRKYYSITQSGMNMLDRKKTEWSEYQDAVARVLGMKWKHISDNRLRIILHPECLWNRQRRQPFWIWEAPWKQGLPSTGYIGRRLRGK